ncbi:MAG: S24 family peptidase [Anaerococcus sp.]|nr:S24 family peptidase [Anaerococcus sp.]
MAKLSQRLKSYRKQNGYTQEAIANKLGLTTSAYGFYEQERNNPPFKMLKRLADIYNISISELTGEPQTHLELLGKAEAMGSYPYIEDPVAAGNPFDIDGKNTMQKLDVPNYILGKYANSKDVFFMRINGESMNKIIPNDSLISVQKRQSISDLKQGDIVVFRTSAFEYSVKQFYINGDYIIFKPLSTDSSYKDIIYNKNDEIEIIGKVILYSVIL